MMNGPSCISKDNPPRRWYLVFIVHEPHDYNQAAFELVITVWRYAITNLILCNYFINLITHTSPTRAITLGELSSF